MGQLNKIIDKQKKRGKYARKDHESHKSVGEATPSLFIYFIFKLQKSLPRQKGADSPHPTPPHPTPPPMLLDCKRCEWIIRSASDKLFKYVHIHAY